MRTFTRHLLSTTQSGLLVLVGGHAQAIAVGDAVPVVHGNFNSPSHTTALDGWTMINPTGEKFIQGGTNNDGYTSSEGVNYSLGVQYLDGWSGNPNHPVETARHNIVGIYQDLSGLTTGATYELSFWSLATHTASPGNEHWKVTFGTETHDGVTVDANTSPDTWFKSTMSFVATQATQRLQFEAIFVGAQPGVSPEILRLDGVQMTVSAVPEPSTTAMALAGLTALGFMVRRRSKRQD